jgi:oligopeptidase B
MALAEDYLSRRQYSLRFCNLQNGEWYPEVLENVSPEFAWSNDSQTLWYVRKHPTTLLPYQVWRHTVGASPLSDVLVYEEKDETFYVSLHKTTSQQFVVIYLASATTSEVLLLNNCRMPSRSVSCRGVKITNTVSITISTLFIFAPTARGKLWPLSYP